LRGKSASRASLDGQPKAAVPTCFVRDFKTPTSGNIGQKWGTRFVSIGIGERWGTSVFL